jgi:hypothetical protein
MDEYKGPDDAKKRVKDWIEKYVVLGPVSNLI